MLADKGLGAPAIIAIQRIEQLEFSLPRREQILQGEYAVPHELRGAARPVVVAHLEADAVVDGVELREAARIFTPDVGAGS